MLSWMIECWVGVDRVSTFFFTNTENPGGFMDLWLRSCCDQQRTCRYSWRRRLKGRVSWRSFTGISFCRLDLGLKRWEYIGVPFLP